MEMLTKMLEGLEESNSEVITHTHAPPKIKNAAHPESLSITVNDI